MNYSAEEIVFLNKEKEQIAWKEKYGIKVPELERRINQLLLSDSDQDKVELIEIFRMQDTLDHYLHVEKIAVMSIMISAYELEREKNIDNTIINGKRNLEELFHIYIDLKFMIWRIEFGQDDTTAQLGAYIKENKLSSYFIQFIVIATAFDKEFLLKKIFLNI